MVITCQAEVDGAAIDRRSGHPDELKHWCGGERRLFLVVVHVVVDASCFMTVEMGIGSYFTGNLLCRIWKHID